MSLSITTAQVYARLRTLISTDFYSSADIADYFIVDAIARVNQTLSNNSKDFDNLTSDEKRICQNIACLYACSEVIESAPESDYEDGPVTEKAIKSGDKISLSERLENKIKGLFSLIQCATIRSGVSYSGGSDYVPDGENKKNIDFSDTENEFDVWS